MGKTEKLLLKARRNPDGLSFEEFETLMVRCGFCFDRQEGSHRIYMAPNGMRQPVQPRGNMAKGYQVRQFLTLLEEMNHG